MYLSKDNVKFFDSSKIKLKKILVLSEDKNVKLGDYKNFMSKEIFEQPSTIKNCLNEYLINKKRHKSL